jgi:hypothetical protein
MSLFQWIKWFIIRTFFPEKTPLEGRPLIQRARMKTSHKDIRMDATGKPVFVKDIKKGRRYL